MQLNLLIFRASCLINFAQILNVAAPQLTTVLRYRCQPGGTAQKRRADLLADQHTAPLTDAKALLIKHSLLTKIGDPRQSPAVSRQRLCTPQYADVNRRNGDNFGSTDGVS